MKNVLLPLICLLYSLHLPAQNSSDLHAGPMVGYSEMYEVMIWVQAAANTEVQIRYQAAGEEAQYSTTALALPVNANTVHIRITDLQPGTRYQAQLYLNGKPEPLKYPFHFQTQVHWQYRTDPPAVRFVTGSCAFTNEPERDRPGKGYGGKYGIWEEISKTNADFMVWLGDNIYFRETDWTTRDGMRHRYSYARSRPELQPLLAGMHHYATWDDHDFGPNDSDRSFQNKDLAQETFELFWANQRYGLPGIDGGIMSKFTWGDCDFFLLDDRYFRSPNHRVTGDRVYFGEEQLQWLIDALVNSKATFKFVCTGGMVLSTYEKHENMALVAPRERTYLLETIQKEKIKGLIFLTGDRHHTELSHWKPEGGLPVYDLTCSPLTSTSYDTDEPNAHKVEGTVIGDHNFGLLEVTGEYGDRTLKMTIIDVDGEMRWTREIHQNEWEKVREKEK